MSGSTRPHLLAVLVALVALALGGAGCQLVDRRADLQPTQDERVDATEAGELRGSPEDEFPTTIAELRAFVRPEALTWQDEPFLVDLTVWMDQTQRWERARVTYVATEADRLLTIRVAPDSLRLDRPLLGGLGLPELPAAATAELAGLPEATLEPAPLSEAATGALRRCDAGGTVVAVIYATGAPAAWDGEGWTTLPTWQATVVTAEGGVVVDPTSGSPYAPLQCVEPISDVEDVED